MGNVYQLASQDAFAMKSAADRVSRLAQDEVAQEKDAHPRKTRNYTRDKELRQVIANVQSDATVLSNLLIALYNEVHTHVYHPSCDELCLLLEESIIERMESIRKYATEPLVSPSRGVMIRGVVY